MNSSYSRHSCIRINDSMKVVFDDLFRRSAEPMTLRCGRSSDAIPLNLEEFPDGGMNDRGKPMVRQAHERRGGTMFHGIPASEADSHLAISNDVSRGEKVFRPNEVPTVPGQAVLRREQYGKQFEV